MGFFKRRRERESAIPPSTLEGASVEPGAPAEAPPAPTPAPQKAPAEPAEERGVPLPPPPGDGSIADEVAAAVGGDLATHVERLRSLMAQHSVDLQKLPEKQRKAVVRDLNRQGVPAKMDAPLEVNDIPQVHAIEAVLRKHGVIPEDESAAAA